MEGPDLGKKAMQLYGPGPRLPWPGVSIVNLSLDKSSNHTMTSIYWTN